MRARQNCSFRATLGSVIAAAVVNPPLVLVNSETVLQCEASDGLAPSPRKLGRAAASGAAGAGVAGAGLAATTVVVVVVVAEGATGCGATTTVVP